MFLNILGNVWNCDDMIDILSFSIFQGSRISIFQFLYISGKSYQDSHEHRCSSPGKLCSSVSQYSLQSPTRSMYYMVNAIRGNKILCGKVNVHFLSLFWLKQDQKRMKSYLLGYKTIV